MDRVRQASSTMMNDKRSGKHLVSLKNITFEGSQRKLSVLHPSHHSNKLSAKFAGSDKIESGKIGSQNIGSGKIGNENV